MSEISNAGSKGYVILGIFIALLLFVVLVVYLYQYNNRFVPEDPEYWSTVIAHARSTYLA